MRNKQLFVCGSAAKILNSNYFQRKIVPNMSAFKKITLVVDYYIFHDPKENRIVLGRERKQRKYGETFSQWDSFLDNTLKNYNSMLGVSDLKKWTSLRKSGTRYKNFLLAIDDANFQVDIIKCPICNQCHVGPFPVVDKKFVKLPCYASRIDVKKLGRSVTRLKRGYLQLYIAWLKKGIVLASPEFIHTNKDIIERFGLENYFLPQTRENTVSQTLLMDEYVNNFDCQYIHLDKDKSLMYYVKRLGFSVAIRYYLRDKLRKHGLYKISDKFRNQLKLQNIFINDEKDSSTLVIKKRML